MHNHNHLFYVRPSPKDGVEIIKAKTYEQKSARAGQSFYSQVSDERDHIIDGFIFKSNSTASSGSLHSSRTLPDEASLMHQVKLIYKEVLTDQAVEKLVIQSHSFDEWLNNFKEKCNGLQTFFKNNALLAIIDEAFNTEDPNIKITLVLTLDYYTNIVTFIFFLLWKWIQNEQQQEMHIYMACQASIIEIVINLLKYRVNEFRTESALLSFLDTFLEFVPKELIEECSRSINDPRYFEKQLKIVQVTSRQILPWLAHDFAIALSNLNQQFYAELQISNLLNKKGADAYFKRINALSMYIIYSVVKYNNKYDRQDALSYWLDVSLQLYKNEDLEGLFIIYKYAIEVLLRDYIQKMPLKFRDLEIIRVIEEYYNQKIKDNFRQRPPNNKNYCIPSFQKCWSYLKKLELSMKQDAKVLKSIGEVLGNLVNISKTQNTLFQKDEIRVIFPNNSLQSNEQQIHRFLQYGAEKELESALKIPLSKDTLVYIELIKLSRTYS